MSERGQTETIGFVLVFTLIMLSVGAVYLTGFSGLQASRDAEQVNNVERAFDVLADNLAEIYRNGAPSRATELRVPGGSIGFGGSTTVTVAVENTMNASDNTTVVASADPVVYESQGGAKIVYAQGAVFRERSGGSVMLSSPDWLIDQDRSVLPLVVTYASGNQTSMAGSGSILVVANRETRRVAGVFRTNDSASARVAVTVDSDRADAWKQYFEDEGLTAVDADATDGTVTYRFTTDAVYVSRTDIGMVLEQ
ncbi:MAG: hypothetical protein ABEJ08_03990 [Halobacteriaceae archaeon]